MKVQKSHIFIKVAYAKILYNVHVRVHSVYIYIEEFHVI